MPPMTTPTVPEPTAITPESSPLLVLDTNILIYGVRGGDRWQRIKDACDPLMVMPRPAMCVVSDGEVRSFAEQLEWGEGKRERMQFLLDYFGRFDISRPEVLVAYARIDAFSRRLGAKMGKNDLWIAAVANVSEAVLVTTDRDFDHLDGVFFTRLLITL